MRELFPVLSGAIVGGLVMTVRPPRLRVVSFVIGCMVFGLIASFMSGEIAESWAFFTIDSALVWFGGLAVVMLLTSIRFGKPVLKYLSKSDNKTKN